MHRDNHHAKALLWIASKVESVKLPLLDEVTGILDRQGQSLEQGPLARNKLLYDDEGKTQVRKILIGAPWFHRMHGCHNRSEIRPV